MKYLRSALALLALCSAMALAQGPREQDWKALGTLKNARFVYVTSYDGPQFSPNLFPEDRAAIARVQEEVRRWPGYTLVYRPWQADMILAVQARPSEDVLAVYARGMWPGGTYLWRASRENGFSAEHSALLSALKADLDRTKAEDVR
ncbi:MAG TPA: hypothetical protein VNK82_05770 [Terriglobales bacterium]|nr:hypothetical protein [Terriglobales bacterium]